MITNPSQFSWTGSNEREDGSVYDDASRQGYNVYVYPVGGAPTEVTFIAVSQVDDYAMPISQLSIGEGQYEMVVTDLDTDGRESGYSTPVQFEVKIFAPKPPTGLSAL